MEKAYRGLGYKISPDKRLIVGIIGSGLAGMMPVMELSDAGHNVEIFESRRFVGGKVGSWVDKDGNIGAPLNGIVAFAKTNQLELYDKIANAVALAQSPVIKALFDFDGAHEDIQSLDNI